MHALNERGFGETSQQPPPLLSVAGLTKHFSVGKFFGSPQRVVRAVDDVHFDIPPGETLGVVGESGCGKSTLARLIMRIIAPDSGEVMFDGQRVGGSARELAKYYRGVQMVFQDSYASLNPRLTVEDTVAFGPRTLGDGRTAARLLAHDLLGRAGLDPSRFAERYPHELSGGQRQRVNIARALAVRPRLLILDEAVSALDKSVEAQVLNLLLDLKDEFDLTYIFISHDLNVIRFMADRVMVMYLGKVVEIGEAEIVLGSPRHPYTSALLASMPSMDPDQRTSEAPITGDPPSPIDLPPGCRFNPRCNFVDSMCRRDQPTLRPVDAGHSVACHMAVPSSGHPLAAGTKI
jgi:peptide/nickel transport system ATP-binding protein